MVLDGNDDDDDDDDNDDDDDDDNDRVIEYTFLRFGEMSNL